MYINTTHTHTHTPPPPPPQHEVSQVAMQKGCAGEKLQNLIAEICDRGVLELDTVCVRGQGVLELDMVCVRGQGVQELDKVCVGGGGWSWS